MRLYARLRIADAQPPPGHLSTQLSDALGVFLLMSLSSLTAEIAAEAARLVLDTGLEYDAARRKAARAVARRNGAARAQMPSNEQIEDEVRAQIEIFHADTQPGELAVLRGIAQHWMTRLAPFRPHLGGAVWRGTATRRSAVHLDLYCDDPKSAEFELLDMGLRYEVHTKQEAGDDLDILTVHASCPAFGGPVPVHLAIRDHDALRGALRPDARGRTWRGEIEALRRRMQETEANAVRAAAATEPTTDPQHGCCPSVLATPYDRHGAVRAIDPTERGGAS
jgi:hypothetical protein